MNIKSGWKLAAVALVAVAGAALVVPSVNAAPEKSHTTTKPETKHEAKATTKLSIGQPAPEFKLKDTTGKEFDLASLTKEGKIVVLEWFNSECPVCARHGEEGTMKKIAADYQGKGVVFLGINSGAPGKQGYGKDADAIKKWSLNYPILVDETGTVGKEYGAKTTPHMYIIGKDGKLAYQGAIDNNNTGKLEGDKVVNYVTKALDEIIKGESVSEPVTAPYGCSVKYGS